MVRSPSIDKNGIKKGEWSKEEDDKLRAYINRYGVWNWRRLPKYAGLARCGKSCRLRWKNYLQPNVKRGNFTKEEEDIIVLLHNQLGNKWSIIAKNLTGRTDNEIKNYWHTHFKKQAQGQNLISPSNQVKKVESTSSCQTLRILEEEIDQESSKFDNNNNQQVSAPGLSQGLTSPTISCCSVLSQSYYESSFSCSDDSNLRNILMADDHTTITPTYECFDDFWSQPFENDCMINSYEHQQPFVGLVNPSSPITDQVFLWSYDLSDESIR